MAKRGGSGDLLGSFLRTAWQQLDSVREVVGQKARAGRAQLDLTLLRRKHKEILAEIGEVVAKLADAGQIDEEEFPSLSDPLSRLEALEERIASEERRARAAAMGVPDLPEDRYADEEYDEDLEDAEGTGDAADAEGAESAAGAERAGDAEEYDEPDAEVAEGAADDKDADPDEPTKP